MSSDVLPLPAVDAPSTAKSSQTGMMIEEWPLARVVPYVRNPRKIPDRAVDKVAASIREFGFRQPIVVDGDGTVIVGHTRLLAALKLGLTEVPVHVVREEWSEAKKRAYRLADNRLAQESAWDDELLGLELGDLDGVDLSLTGFEPDEIAKLTGGNGAGLTDPDDVPEVPAEPVSRTGDLWLLGTYVDCPKCGNPVDV